MILLSSINEAIQVTERTDRPAKACELCLEDLGDNIFMYEFDDGEVLVAELCSGCFYSEEDESQLAVKIIAAMLMHCDARIQIIEWLLES